MIIKLNEIKGRMADSGRRVTLDDIAEGTGINRATLDKLIAGDYSSIRLDYIDALCAYFGVTAGELIQAEPITLPLSLNIRPDRHGARVGERTKGQVATAATDLTVAAPSPFIVAPDDGAGRPALPTVAEHAKAPPAAIDAAIDAAMQADAPTPDAPPPSGGPPVLTAASLRKPLGVLIDGENGAADPQAMQKFEERRRMLLAQAQQAGQTKGG